MKSMRLRFFFLLALFSSPSFSSQEIDTGPGFKLIADEWERVHSAQVVMDIKTSGRVGYFIGYVTAVADAQFGRTICPPSGTSYEQMYAVVAKFLKTNPEKWNLSPLLLTSTALTEAFPCSKKRK